MSSTRISVAIFLALVGGALSGLLVLEHYGVGTAAAAVDQLCGADDDSGCEQVSSSPYSSIGNLSVAGVGLFFYASMLFLLSLALVTPESVRDAASALGLAFFGIGILMDLALFLVQTLAIGAFCKLCIGTYVVNLGVFGALLPAFRRLPTVKPSLFEGEGRRALVVWALGSIVIFSTVGALERALASGVDPGVSLLGEASPGTGLAARLERAETQIQELQQTLDDPAKYQAYQEQKALQSFASEPVQEIALQTIPFKGPESAPISVVEFSDFMCPFCQNLAMAFSNYLPESGGRVKIFFKNYPLDQACNPTLSRTIHEGACELALGAVCAEKQGEFWAYHDRVFGAQPTRATAADVVQIATAAGLDGVALRSCMRSDAARKELEAQIEEGRRLEVQGTPTVFINGKRLRQLGGFMQAIESESKRLGLDP